MKFHVIINLGMMYKMHAISIVILFNYVLQKTRWWKYDMYQKSINMLWVIAHD
jgi:hypothetical protein